MNYWLFKSEPSTFSIDNLAKRPKKTEPWDGVRNYQARNFMRDDMKKGDLGFFYHSSCKTPGIVGVVKVVKESYPDATQFDPDSKYYDPKSTQEKPRWFLVDVKLEKKFKDIITLDNLKSINKLKEMVILRPGNRLSITPVSKTEWTAINKI